MEQPRHIRNTALASAARTATSSSGDIEIDAPFHGIAVFLDVTVAAGASNLQLIVEAKDLVSGNYIQVNATPTAVNATGTKCYVIYPGIGAAGGGITQSTSQILPSPFRIRVLHADGNSNTYSVSYDLLP